MFQCERAIPINTDVAVIRNDVSFGFDVFAELFELA
jgi:hypothetical protein